MNFDQSFSGLCSSLFGLLVCLASYWGWGLLICRVAKFEVRSALNEIALGVGTSIFLISLIGYYNQITPMSLWIVVGLGAALLVAFARSIPWRTFGDRYSVATLFIGTAVLLPMMLVWSMNSHDDFHAYLNLPIIAFQTGGLNNIGFLERAIYSLGGQTFLQTAYLLFAPINRISLLDPFLFHILALLSFNSNSLARLQLNRASRYWAIALVACVQLFFVNTTPTGSMAFLILSLIYLMSEDAQIAFRKQALSVAILVGALTCLKATIVVFAAPLCAVAMTIFVFRKQIKIATAIGLTLTTLILTALYLLPSQLISLRNFGTLLFPFLGEGHHDMAKGIYPRGFWDYIHPSISDVIAYHLNTPEIKIIILLLVFTIAAYVKPKKFAVLRANIEASRFLPFLISFTIAYFILTWKTMWESYRYSYPLIVFIFGLGIACGLSSLEKVQMKKWLRVSIIILGVFLIARKGVYRRNYAGLYRSKSASRAFAESEGLLKTYRDAQSHLPEHASVLIFASYPMFFDYKRNNIFLIDWGGTVSPDGRLNTFANDEDFYAYLRSINIDFVIYSYKDEVNFHEARTEYLKHPYLQIQQYARYNNALMTHFENRISNGVVAYKNDELAVIPTLAVKN